MKLNGGPKQYMPIPQSQSDEDENSFLKQSKPILETEKNGIANGCAKNLNSKEISNDEEKQSMSTLRKIFFVISIFLCAFFIILFIWIIPCRLPISSISSLSKDWSLVLNNIDSITTLLLASHSSFPHPILLMGFKDRQDNVSGLMAIDSISGRQLWRKHFYDTPIYSWFGEIDTNNDNVPDCLILGDSGMLFVINVMDGHELWYFHDHVSTLPPPVLFPPILIPSCENRKVYDIIGSIFDEALQPQLVRINSSTGYQKGKPLPIMVCNRKIIAMYQWKHDNITSLIFHCKDKSGNDDIWSITQDMLCHLNQTVTWKKLYSLKNADNVIVKPVEKDIVIMWNNKNIISLNETNIKWRFSNNFTELRIMFDGHFTSDKPEIVLVAKDYSGMDVINIMNFENGEIMWSKVISEAIVVSAKRVPNILPKSDGILLKLNSPFGAFAEQFTNNSFLSNISTDSLSSVNILNESYVLLMCWKSFSFAPLIQNTILTKCENHCWPNMHSSSNTGIVTLQKDTSLRILSVHSTLIPASNLFVFQTTLDSTTFHFQQCSMR